MTTIYSHQFRIMSRLLLISLLFMFGLPTMAQHRIIGQVLDAENGDSIPMATVAYKGHHLTAISDMDGHFAIDRHNGWQLTFSAVGYKPKVITVSASTSGKLTIRLKVDRRQLQTVTVKAKKMRYSRKNNPAVELMKRVVAARKLTDLKRHDYFQYNKYEKMTLALNDITPQQLAKKPFSNKKWLADMVENNPYNDKKILPLSVEETLSKHVYRKEPHKERTIITGHSASGVNDLFETGDIINVAAKDVFTDVNIYDDQVRLLQYPFTSPIGKNAVAFYRYYIVDTVKVDRDSCYHLQFLPNNQQDFGFRGELWILKDSSLHVRRCVLNIPKRSDVNFVENMRIEQEYSKLDNGEWVLSRNDMVAEMSVVKFLQKALVARVTRYSGYDFSALPKSLFKGKKPVVREASAEMRDDNFWNEYRPVKLTKSEGSMGTFIKNIENIKGFKWIMVGMKALIENFVETGTPSKVDIGPINTIISNNFVDGYRLRGSAQTTANFNKNLFLKGYYAHGFDSHKNYYNAEVIWSFNKKDYLPREFPKRTISIQSQYDVGSPSDKFVPTDKDNVFTAFKWDTVDKMMFYNRQKLSFEYEFEGGWKTTFSLKTEKDTPAGRMQYLNMQGIETGGIRTTELYGEVRYAPGETYINTKQRRLTINLDAPTITLGHTMGLKNFLGGDYQFNLTELKIFKRFWMNSWGKIDCFLKGGIQWNKVPYPLLCMPAANLSFLIEDETFNLINNMEFLNDRYASLMLSWDLNGKILNRIPLIRKLKWREFIGINMLWGKLTDKNNPTLGRNALDGTLMRFPERSFVMDPEKPYAELVLGVHNIFKILHVEYVRRLNYNSLPTSKKNGVRFTFRMTF